MSLATLPPSRAGQPVPLLFQGDPPMRTAALARSRGASLLAAALVLAAPVFAVPAFAASSDILAKVDGQPITQGDLDLAVDDLGQSLQGVPPEQQQTYVLGYLIDLKLLARAAEKAKAADSEEFAHRLSYLRDKALMESFLTDAGKTATSDDAMRKVYDENVKSASPEQEVRARHILTETEDQAKAALARIKGGADFAEVAKEVSKDPGSGQQGGELGFFSKDQMVPQFSEVAFKLDPGQISDPVKSDFGWHVIQVEEKRQKPMPSFEDVKPQIANYVTRKAQQETIMKLREGAKIERSDQPAGAMPGAPADAGAPPAQPQP